MATLFAWSGALRKRAQLDNLPELEAFADKLEKVSIQTIEEGIITGDLNNLLDREDKTIVNTEDFLKAIAAKL
jgi:isocitrate dehydrogenase